MEKTPDVKKIIILPIVKKAGMFYFIGKDGFVYEKKMERRLGKQKTKPKKFYIMRKENGMPVIVHKDAELSEVPERGEQCATL